MRNKLLAVSTATTSLQELCVDRYRHADDTPPMEAPKSLSQGAASILMAALDASIECELPITVRVALDLPFLTSRETASTGGFIMDCSLTDIIPHSKGEDNKQKLWKLSNRLVGEEFA